MTGPQQATGQTSGQAPGQTAPAENVPPIKRAQDLFNSGRVSECYAIIKPMIDKAQELGIAVPTLQACYRIVSLLDRYAQS